MVLSAHNPKLHIVKLSRIPPEQGGVVATWEVGEGFKCQPIKLGGILFASI